MVWWCQRLKNEFIWTSIVQLWPDALNGGLARFGEVAHKRGAKTGTATPPQEFEPY